MQIHWVGYSSDYDTWEPVECLENAPQKLAEFNERNKRKHVSLNSQAILQSSPKLRRISDLAGTSASTNKQGKNLFTKNSRKRKH